MGHNGWPDSVGQPVLELCMTKIRDAQEADFNAILQLNAGEEVQTSAMDREKLVVLHGLASHHRVAEVNGQIAAFILVMRETARYQSENFTWFSSRYPRFLYIDRIVVAQRFGGRKIGSALYTDLMGAARADGVNLLVCEYNLDPPNPASKAFHARFGFAEVGTQRVANGAKLVSLQAAHI